MDEILTLTESVSEGFPSYSYINLYRMVLSRIKFMIHGFDFDIVTFPFLGGGVPRSASYGLYISQPVRFARVSSPVDDLNTRNKVLTTKTSQTRV